MKKTDLEMLTSYCRYLWTERILKDGYPPSEDLLAAINRLASDGNEPAITPLGCLLYTSPSPRDRQKSRMPSSA